MDSNIARPRVYELPLLGPLAAWLGAGTLIRPRMFPLTRLHHAIAAVVFLLAGGTFWWTMFPTVYTFDSAELATGAYTLGIVHPTGYPLWLLLGKLFMFLPFGDIAYRANLMSVLMASLTILVLYYVLLDLTAGWLISATTSLSFAFSFYFWDGARAAEVYTLHTLFMAVLFLILVRWAAEVQRSGRVRRGPLLLFAFLYGLSFTNHMSSAFLALGFTYFILISGRLEVLRLSVVLPMFGVFLFGWLPYLYLPIRDAANPSMNYARELQVSLGNLEGMYWMVSAQVFKQFMFLYSVGDIPGEILKYAGWLSKNFVGLGVIVGLVGIWYTARYERHLLVALLLIFVPSVAFFINYYVFDKETMFLPTYFVWAILLAKGLQGLAERIERLERRAVRLQRAYVLGCLALMWVPFAVNFARMDAHENTVVRRFSERVLDNAAPNSLVVADWVTVTPLQYLQLVEGKRTDVGLFYWFIYSQRRLPELVDQGVPLQQAFGIVDQEMIDIIRKELLANRAVYSIGGPPAFWNAFNMEPLGNYQQVRLKQ